MKKVLAAHDLFPPPFPIVVAAEPAVQDDETFSGFDEWLQLGCCDSSANTTKSRSSSHCSVVRSLSSDAAPGDRKDKTRHKHEKMAFMSYSFRTQT
jgi:hypothetical protein